MRRAITAAATLLMTAGTGLGVAHAAAPHSTDIHFRPGTTSGTVSGRLGPQAEREYTFAAQAKQTAEVTFARSSATERWTLVGPHGNPLHTAMTIVQNHATVRLPATGVYRIDVQTADPATYRLQLTLPVRIRFAPGTDNTTVSGWLGAGQTRNYTFTARGGQHAVVHFNRSSGNELWTLRGPAGNPLHTGMTNRQGYADVALPGSGVYRLDVQSATPGTYSLHLAIPAG